jgi:PQQ-like domain
MASGKCTNCGGQLPIPDAGRPFLKCHFCGQVVPLAPPPRPAAPPTSPEGRARFVAPRRTGTPLASILVSVVFVLATAGTGIMRALRPAMTAGSNRVAVIAAALGEPMQWDSQRSPYPAQINGDRIEDFVGAYSESLTSSGNTKRVEYLGGFDGATLKRLWAAGPFGDSGDSRGFAFAVAGARAMVTDSRSIAHILDVATGREVGKVTLSDRAKSICPSPSKSEAWVEVSDEQNVIVDLTAGTSSKAARPPYCRPDRSSLEDVHCRMHPLEEMAAACKGVDPSFRAPNFRADRMLIDGDASVIIGTKSPGSQIPTAVGYDPKAKRILWQRAIPQGDLASVRDGLGLIDMAHDRLIAQFQLNDSTYNLAAIDARTGNPLWETEIPHSKQGIEASRMTITPTRVYLPHWTWLDVFDARTGSVVGTVGRW